MNQVCISGNLTKDIELRKTQSGNSVASFTLGVKRDYKTGDEYMTDFIDCVAWNQAAEYLSKYASKGSYVEVSGSIMKRDYENQEGKRIYITEVKADKVKAMSRDNEKKETKPEPKKEEYTDGGLTFTPEELPFY